MKNIELYVNGQLITGIDDADLQLELSVKQVQAPDKASSSFTYDFEIPGNKNNNIIFNHIYEITEQGRFNPNRANDAELKVNGITEFVGSLQLNRIEKRYVNSNEYIVYNCTIYSYTKSLFLDAKNMYVNELDFSEFDHKPTYENTVNSWSNYTGYTYPLIDYGWDLQYNGYANTGLNIGKVDISAYNCRIPEDGIHQPYFPLSFLRLEDLYPSVYAKTILDKIFETFGYTYKSDFFDSDAFRRIIIPYSVEAKHPINDFFSAKTTTIIYPYINYQAAYIAFDNIIYDYYNMYHDLWKYYGSNAYAYPTTKALSTFYSHSGPGGGIDGELELILKWVETGTIPNSIEVIKAPFGYDVNQYTSYNEYINVPYLDAEVIAELPLTAGTYTYIVPNISLNFGELIYFRFKNQGGAADQLDKLLPGSTIHFYNKSKFTGLTQDVQLERCVPQDLKVCDFLTTLNKMFNLYWEIDRENNNKFLIEPYESYYSNTGATIIDWNEKIEKETVKISLSQDDVYSRYLFTYKDTDDWLNKFWKNTYSTIEEPIYGSRTELNLNNVYLEDKQLEIKLDPFAPTITSTIGGIKNYYFPHYLADDVYENPVKNTNVGCRMVYYNGVDSCGNYPYYFDDNQFYVYPQASTLNSLNQNSSARDLNFKTRNNDVLTAVTKNNLYELYWKNYIDSVNNEHFKLVEATVHLDEIDLYKLKLNDTIVYDGCYWHINKLVYNIGENLHNVELLKVNDNYENGRINFGHDFSAITGVGIIARPPAHVINVGTINNVTIGPALVIGSANTVKPIHLSASSNNILIVGDGNEVTNNNKNLTIFGDNNKASNVSNSIILGSNITATTSNSTIIGGSLFLENGNQLAQGLKHNINSGDTITVEKDYQYHIYEDLSLSGKLTTSGQVLVENGDLIVNGDLIIDGNYGEVKIIDEDCIVYEKYAGIIDCPSFKDNGDGSVTIGSGSVSLYKNSCYTGDLYYYTFPSSVIVTSANTVGYIYVAYNSTTKNVNLLYTSNQENISQSSEQIIYTVYNKGNVVTYRLGWDSFGSGLPEKLHNRLIKTSRFVREFSGGLILSESGVRNVNISQGYIWYGAVRKLVEDFDSTTDEMLLMYHSSGVWTSTTVTQYNNTQYDDLTDLVILSNNNRYTSNWVYRMIDDETVKRTIILLSNSEYSTLEEAKVGTQPVLPDLILKGGMLVGRIIVQKNINTGYIESAFSTVFAGTSVTNHNDLGNLDGGNPTTTYYGHLGANVGTNNYIQKVTDSTTNTIGNSQIYDNGTGVGIGTTSPAYKLDVKGATATDGIRSDIGFDINPVVLPERIATYTLTGGTGLEIGTYWYWLSYYTALGETGIRTEPSIITTLGNQQVTITNIPVSTDYRVTGKRIYRGRVGQQWNAYLLADIPNEQATYTDSTPDVSLPTTNNYYRINSTSRYISYNGYRSMVIDNNMTAFGLLAGYNITTGGRNVLLGQNAGASLTAGGSNVLIGHVPGGSLTNGSSNIAIGEYTCRSANSPAGGAVGNICIGPYVGYNFSNDYLNTLIGNQAGYTLNGKAYNTFLGHYAGRESTSNWSMFFGSFAGKYETEDNKLIIDSLDRTTAIRGRNEALIYGVVNPTPANQILSLGGGGKVGVGTISPTEKLTVSGNTYISGGLTASTIYSGNTDLNDLFSPTGHTHQVSGITNLQNVLNTKANLSGATFTGNVEAPSISINSTYIQPYHLSNRIYVGVSGDFLNLEDAINWFNGSALENTEILIDAGIHTIFTSCNVNNPSCNLIIRGSSDSTTILKPDSSMAGNNSPIFDVRSNCYIVDLTIDSDIVNSGYGDELNENAINLISSCYDDFYCEMKNITINGTYQGIYVQEDAYNTQFFLFNSIIKNCYQYGIYVDSNSKKTVFDVEISNFENISKSGIYLYSGTDVEFDILSCFFLNPSGSAAGIEFNPSNTSLNSGSNHSIISNKWNGVEKFLAGFDFTRSDGRDANVYIMTNVGYEDKNPHCKINVENNSSTTTITSANTYYKAVFTNTNYYTCKFTVTDNKIVYQPRNKRDCMAWISGNIQTNGTNRIAKVGILKNGTGSIISQLAVRCATANQPYSFSICAYIEDVSQNDYYEIYVTSSTNGDLVLLQDLTFMVNSK